MALVKKWTGESKVTLARDIPMIPYMGSLEDAYRAAWDNTWFTARSHLRTMDDGITVDDCYHTAFDELDQATARLYTPVAIISARAVNSAALAAYDTHAPLSKAGRSSAARKLSIVRPHRVPAPHTIHTQAHVWHLKSAQAQTMNLIVAINQKQRSAVKSKIVSSIRDGVTVDLTGKQIANLVGLFPRWQRAVNNYHARLIANGSSPARAQLLTDRYSDWLIRRRGMMIARTELMRSMNEGRLMGWDDLASQGAIRPYKSVKEWVAAPGACPDCKAMDGVKVHGLHTEFKTDRGDVITPPLHPHCRCTMTLHPSARPGFQMKGLGIGRPVDFADMADPALAKLLDNM